MKTYINQEQITNQPVLGNAPRVSSVDTSSGLRSLGKEIQGLGSDLNKIHKTQQYLDAKESKQREDMNIDESYSRLQLHWTRQYDKYTKTDNEDVSSLIEEDYDLYVDDAKKKLHTKREIQEFDALASKYKINLISKSQLLQQRNRALNFGKRFDELLTNSQEIIYHSKDLQTAIEQQNFIDSVIDKAKISQRITDAKTEKKLRSKSDQLIYSWGLSAVSEQPETVLKALDQTDLMKGISIERKEALRNKANQVLKMDATMDKSLIRKTFKDEKVRRLRTGVSTENFSYEDAKLAFGETEANIMLNELDMASKLYSVNIESQGASTQELMQIRNKSIPSTNSKNYALDSEYYDRVEEIIVKQQQRKQDDAYLYYATNPAVSGLVEIASENPQDLEIQKQVQNSILELQKMDTGLSSNDYAVMPKQTAKNFINDFNNMVSVGSETDPQSFLNQVSLFKDMFGENIDIAFRQLSNLKGGDKIQDKINPLLWHTDNPSSFNLIFNSIKKPREELVKRYNSTELTDFNETFSLDKNLINYSASVLSSDSSSQSFDLVNGVREAYNHFALDYVANGGSMEEASNIFFSRYAFSEINDVPYARTLSYEEDGELVQVTPEMVELSEAWLREEIKSMSMLLEKSNYLDLDPETVLPIVFEENINEDLADQIQDNGFWVTNENEDGVYLFVKGQYLGAPVQVKKKNGSPVEILFKDTYKGRTIINNNRTQTRARTDDGFWDKMGRTFERLSD